MSKGKRRKNQNNDSARIDRRVAGIEPSEIGKVIYNVDAYRSHVFYDISWVDALVKRRCLGREFSNNWKDIHRNLMKMARVTSSIPGLIRLARIQSYFETLWQVSVPIMFILLFASIMAPNIPIIGVIAPYVMIIAFTSLFTGLFSRFLIGHRIGERIRAYFDENPEAYSLRESEVRKAVQLLIDELSRYLLITGEDPEDHVVAIGKVDYQNIEITKAPKPWRKYYIVKILTDPPHPI
jgi:hypothetical protein